MLFSTVDTQLHWRVFFEAGSIKKSFFAASWNQNDKDDGQRIESAIGVPRFFLFE